MLTISTKNTFFSQNSPKDEKPRIGWMTVAYQSKETSMFWRPLPACPTGIGVNALSALRQAVSEGRWIMAQRKIGPSHYLLLIQEPIRNKT
jgi:hypothetical protein